MNVTFDFPAERVDGFVKYVFSDQLPFVEAQSINDVAKGAQRVQRAHQREVFTVRRPGFVDNAVKIKPFATKDRPEARVWVDPPGGQARASILAQHEADEVKTPFRRRAIAVPTGNVPRTGAGIIKKGWRPKDLFAGARVTTSDRQLARGGGVLVRNQVVRGARETWMIRKPDGTGTIFLRDGEVNTVLYQLVPQVDLDQRLKFVTTISDSVVKDWPDAFVRRFDRAIRTAR